MVYQRIQYTLLGTHNNLCIVGVVQHRVQYNEYIRYNKTVFLVPNSTYSVQYMSLTVYIHYISQYTVHLYWYSTYRMYEAIS